MLDRRWRVDVGVAPRFGCGEILNEIGERRAQTRAARRGVRYGVSQRFRPRRRTTPTRSGAIDPRRTAVPAPQARAFRRGERPPARTNPAFRRLGSASAASSSTLGRTPLRRPTRTSSPCARQCAWSCARRARTPSSPAPRVASSPERAASAGADGTRRTCVPWRIPRQPARRPRTHTRKSLRPSLPSRASFRSPESAPNSDPPHQKDMAGHVRENADLELAPAPVRTSDRERGGEPARFEARRAVPSWVSRTWPRV
jgi:hypothetical protein